MKNNTKNIWIYNHYATSPKTGPLPRHFYFGKRLKKANYSPIIIASNQLHATENEIPVNKGKYTKVTEDGIDFLYLKTIRYKGNGVKRILNMISFYFKCLSSRRNIEKQFGKPDIIYASSAHLLTCLAGLKIAKKYKIPCVCEVRDLWPEELFTVGKVKEKSLFGKMLLKMERTIYQKSDALIFTKEGDTDHIKEMGWDKSKKKPIDLQKCHYINNGVDFDLWNENFKTNQYNNDVLSFAKLNKKFIVGYCGSIRPMNNIGLLVDTASLLKNVDDVFLVVAGSGSLLDSYRTEIKERGLNNIIFTGYIEKSQIPSFLSQTNLNVLVYSSSHYNWSRGNSSNKLFEYLASGKPVISTMKTGYSIIEKYSCGTELEQCDAEHLKDAILDYKKMSPSNYNDICIKAKNASKDFDFDVLSERLISLLDKLYENNR